MSQCIEFFLPEVLMQPVKGCLCKVVLFQGFACTKYFVSLLLNVLVDECIMLVVP